MQLTVQEFFWFKITFITSPRVPKGVLFLVSSYNIGRLTLRSTFIFNAGNIFVYSKYEVS